MSIPELVLKRGCGEEKKVAVKYKRLSTFFLIFSFFSNPLTSLRGSKDSKTYHKMINTEFLDVNSSMRAEEGGEKIIIKPEIDISAYMYCSFLFVLLYKSSYPLTSSLGSISSRTREKGLSREL